MSDISQTAYTPQHGSCAESPTICEQCQTPFLARIRHGGNRDRFCSPRCRYCWHNKRRAQEVKGPNLVTQEAGPDGKQQKFNNTHPSTLRPGTKLYTIATALCRGEHLDCFTAVRRFHDYVLRSTISELKRRYGIMIDREMKQVPGFSGKLVSCAEYSADAESIRKLGELLGGRNGESQRSSHP